MAIPVSGEETLQVRLGKDECALGDTLSYSLALTSNEPVSSRIVYVEWLTPEGFLVDRQVRRLENGKVEGSVPVLAKNYSGLYEFRAYTRYMLRGGNISARSSLCMSSRTARNASKSACSEESIERMSGNSALTLILGCNPSRTLPSAAYSTTPRSRGICMEMWM